MKRITTLLLAAGAWLAAGSAAATTLTFDDLAAGTTLSSQYSSLGVTFSANAFSGIGNSSSAAPWATNTDMTIVASTGTDSGTLGSPSLVSGNVLRSYSNYLLEDGDASFRMSFSTAAAYVSMTFAGVDSASDVRLFVYDGSSLLAVVAGSGSASQFALTYSAPSITSVVVAPGSFDDYVVVDDIVYTTATVAAVPESGTFGLSTVGLGIVAVALRRRERRSSRTGMASSPV